MAAAPASSSRRAATGSSPATGSATNPSRERVRVASRTAGRSGISVRASPTTSIFTKSPSPDSRARYAVLTASSAVRHPVVAATRVKRPWSIDARREPPGLARSRSRTASVHELRSRGVVAPPHDLLRRVALGPHDESRPEGPRRDHQRLVPHSPDLLQSANRAGNRRGRRAYYTGAGRRRLRRLPRPQCRGRRQAALLRDAAPGAGSGGTARRRPRERFRPAGASPSGAWGRGRREGRRRAG